MIHCSSWTKPFLQLLACRRGAVMDRTEPDIEGKFDTAVITLEISMVEPMMNMTDRYPPAFAKQHFMKTSMAENRRKRQHIAVEHDQNRMRRHNKMKQ